MKRLIITALCFASLGVSQAQQTDSSGNPVLKNFDDSVSYCVGISVANFYKQQGVKELNTTLVSKAVNDILSGKASLIGDNEANTILNNFFSRLQAEKSKSTIEAGEKFLATNKMRPEVKITASGLQYEVIKEGTGIKPLAADTFVCNYRGTFVDGKQFDASYDRGEPLILPVTSVIKGWTEGLQLMPVGSRYKFYIPYQLGYGAYDYGSIPGGSALIFDVELLDVKKKNP
ncbi:MAG TPA: FKBP-type peptidyl-prolyl cis-trans isomerase [Chitinophagaceae bacterium]|nr:FKBP-type peptidyl-prolyl cis-trans isomerase [Chitinophagaceae bacterium]MCB9056509.1 FKBP-type peptidyl-prolyl cis-trans isomerase [Chitinophagales bacterium]HPG11206.1 FKBP-type peptidyl-prolyl cis-trans isomerase [Chitinophagaceae bacterium]HRX93692.1 FKBP-type peptidyl-prolyl cis-trans isomerase [Chitinophagaceae bacterium]